MTLFDWFVISSNTVVAPKGNSYGTGEKELTLSATLRYTLPGEIAPVKSRVESHTIALSLLNT